MPQMKLCGNKKAGDGNRTHVSSLEGWCSTIELHPLKCPEPESNQRHKDFQSFALPTELSGLVSQRQIIFYTKIIHLSTKIYSEIKKRLCYNGYCSHVKSNL